MHPAELRFLEIAQRFATVGIQAAQAYNQEQGRLDLDHVLTQERLATPEGTQQSLQTLAQLRRLTAAHREAHSTFVLAASSELAAALAQLPPEMQSERQAGLVDSINWQLNAQAEFYATRERWTTAAEAVCRLVDERRASCTFDAAGVDFADDADAGRFVELLGVIEDAHRSEVEALKERLTRLGQSAAALGIVPAA